jgi:hypothetical protein
MNMKSKSTQTKMYLQGNGGKKLQSLAGKGCATPINPFNIKKILHYTKAMMLMMVLLCSSIAVQAVNYYTAANGAPETLANWWTGTIGTGGHPANFTTAGDVFIIQTGHVMTQVATWTVISLTVNSGGTLSIGAQDLIVTGPVNNGGTISATSGQLRQQGGIGDLTNTGTITFTGAGRIYFSGNMTNSGTLTLKLGFTEQTQLLTM